MDSSLPPAYTLIWTETFACTARKFLRRHPDLAGLFEDVLRQLETDPYAARLHLHPLHGRHQGKHAARLTYAFRIVFILAMQGNEITLLDVGAHDEVHGE